MRPLTAAAAAVLAAGTVLGAIAPVWAQPATVETRVVTHGSPLNIRARPGTTAPVVASLPPGAEVVVRCVTDGDPVTGTRGTTSSWGAVDGGYVSLAFVATATVGPRCPPAAPAAPAVAPPLPPHAPAGAVRADDVPGPATAPAPAPAPAVVTPTRSWYSTTASPDVLAAAGCAQGSAPDPDHTPDHGPAPVVVLIFGGFTDRSGSWAFDLYRGRAAPPDRVIEAAATYAASWDRCAVAPAARLTLVFATTTSTGVTDATAGAAFAAVARHARHTIETRTPRVRLLAGNDIELGYIAPGPARAWVDAFHGAGGSSATRPLVNVGDAAGCPGDRVPAGGDCGSAEHPSWTAEDVWHVNGGAGPTLVMPGIYVTDGIQARQWANLDRYAVERHGSPLRFLGALSQIAACRERPCTDRVRNDAGAAWTQLRTALAGRELAVSDMAWLYGPD